MLDSLAHVPYIPLFPTWLHLYVLFLHCVPYMTMFSTCLLHPCVLNDLRNLWALRTVRSLVPFIIDVHYLSEVPKCFCKSFFALNESTIKFLLKLLKRRKTQMKWSGETSIPFLLRIITNYVLVISYCYWLVSFFKHL